MSREEGKKGKKEEGKEGGDKNREGNWKKKNREGRTKKETLMISIKNFQKYNSILENISVFSDLAIF